jgi:hypothetical protein
LIFFFLSLTTFDSDHFTGTAEFKASNNLSSNLQIICLHCKDFYAVIELTIKEKSVTSTQDTMYNTGQLDKFFLMYKEADPGL